MKQIHINDIVVNNGLSLRGNTALDDRLVWEGFDSLYVYEESPESCPLYGQAYQGMIIIMFDVVEGEPKSYMMFLKDASPYIPGMGGSVTEENYLDYWRQDSVDYEQIMKFVAGHNTKPGDKVVGYFGDVTGMTAAELNELDTKEVISRILFEFCVPTCVSSPGLTIRYHSGSPYRVPVEVGSAMPKSTEFSNTFTQDVWKWVSSHNPETTGIDQYLCDRNGAVTFYLNNGGADAILDNVTTKVVEGTDENGRIFAKKPYISTGFAKDSRGSDSDPVTEEYYHEGESGTATSNVLTVTGGWKAYANAPKVYSSLNEAWNKKNIEPGSMPSPIKTRTVTSPFVMTENLHKLYVQWPSATTDEQKFYVWVPASYQISGAKSANNLTPAYDIELEYTLETTVSVTNAQGAQGQYKLYYIGKAPGITNAEITMTKA
jgi:hypothetical protein